VRCRALIPSIRQVLRLAEALGKFKPGLGDVAMVLAFTGLRWEEAVAIPAANVDLESQSTRSASSCTRAPSTSRPSGSGCATPSHGLRN
jgi:hypothetical protein